MPKSPRHPYSWTLPQRKYNILRIEDIVITHCPSFLSRRFPDVCVSLGVEPARRISAVATALLYAFAVAVPFLHNYVMANVGL